MRFSLLCAAVAAALVAPTALAQEPPAPRGDGELMALVQRAGASADNGDADQVAVFKRTTVDVEDSGLAHIVEWQVIKCLTEKGAGQLSRLRFDYDPLSNTVEIRRARLLRRTGPPVVLDPARALDLPQPQQAIYWGARMKVLPLPRLAVGDAVEVETYTKGFLIAYLDEIAGPAAGSSGAGEDEKYVPPMRGHFYDVVYFQDEIPVRLRHYSVTTPRNKPIQFEVYNGEVKSFVSFDADRLSYRFWKENLPAFHAEPRAVAGADVQPKVVLATVPSWKDKSRWFSEVNEPQFAANDAIRAKVAELTRGLARDDDKISAIVHWAADNIRYSGVTMGKGEGYTLHSGAMIYEDRSGVCKDKAGMAITMLRAAGFTVYPAMTMAGARVERVPADQFNHCVTALKKNDGSYELLDPTWVVLSPELWSSAEGEQNFLIGAPEGQELAETPAFDPAANKVRIDSTLTLGADGVLSGVLVVTAKGVAEQRLRRELAQGQYGRDRQSWFERLINGIAPGAEVAPVKVAFRDLADVGKPLRLEISFRAPHYAMISDGRLFFAPPAARHPLRGPSLAPYLEAAGLARRTQAVQLGAPRMMEASETITLPAGLKVARLPRDRSLGGRAASLTTQARLSGGKLVYDYRLTVAKRVVPVDDYANFRDVVQEAKALADDLVVLEPERR